LINPGHGRETSLNFSI